MSVTHVTHQCGVGPQGPLSSSRSLTSSEQRTVQVAGPRISMFRDHQITIGHHPQKGLLACVQVLTEVGIPSAQFDDLPVEVIPRELKSVLRDPHQLASFLARASWIPNRGVDGQYSSVIVRPALKGGMHPKIPFQPGLALGSLFNGDLLRQMQQYAEWVDEQERLEQQLEGVRQQQKTFSARQESYSAESFAHRRLQSQINQLKELETALENRLLPSATPSAEGGPPTPPIFSRFTATLASPIDLQRSKMVVEPRSFDSLHFSSRYFDFTEATTSFSDRVRQAGSSGAVTAGGGFLFFRASASISWSNSTTDRIIDIKNSKIARGVLMIHAMVTTRHVRCFDQLVFHHDALRLILDAMRGTCPNAGKEHGISVEETGEKAIYLLTEAVLGGSFTALVTVLTEAEMERRRSLHAKARGSEVSVGGSVWGLGGSVSTGTHSTDQSEEDPFSSSARTGLEIEIISQGVIPTFARDVMEREIVKHLDLNPAHFELSAEDLEDAQKLATTSSHKDRSVLALKRMMKMENAQAAVMNACRGLIAERQKLFLHGPESVMQAYESFAQKITSDDGCGVPVGFNYTRLSQRQIEGILAREDFLERPAPAAEGEV